ncbi:MAG: transglutaminase-like domain-containing protein [Planctomycetota bacterium]
MKAGQQTAGLQLTSQESPKIKSPRLTLYILMRNSIRYAVVAILLVSTQFAFAQQDRWWNDSVEAALAKSGDNRTTWTNALASVSDSQRPALEFLLAHMPKRDLQTLKSDRILETIRLAYAARDAVPWGKSIPDELFFNDVLPYCNIDEPRDPWRADFYERFLAIAKTCKTPGEAAHKLNQEIFKIVNVKYSTKRKRANQSPKESIDQGLASCTGLSIILSDACRSVCVPARLAGIANWTDKRGNHTWVEVWDKGWHFAGAAEPASEGLDHGWFSGDASKAIEDSYEHSIRAVSYRKTKDKWPLVWSRDTEISAVNVTKRYTAKPAKNKSAGEMRLRVKVYDAAGNRVAAKVDVKSLDSDESLFSGTSKDESNDTNDILEFAVPRRVDYHVTADLGSATAKATVLAQDDDLATVSLVLQ